jgi:hypothetical protein
LEDSVPVIGPSIAAFAFLRFQKFRNCKESMSANVRSQKMGNQKIAEKINFKGNAARTVGSAGNGRQKLG